MATAATTAATTPCLKKTVAYLILDGLKNPEPVLAQISR